MSGFNLLNLLNFIIFHNPDTFYLPVPFTLTLSVIIKNRTQVVHYVRIKESYVHKVSVSPIVKRNQTLPDGLRLRGNIPKGYHPQARYHSIVEMDDENLNSVNICTSLMCLTLLLNFLHDALLHLVQTCQLEVGLRL